MDVLTAVGRVRSGARAGRDRRTLEQKMTLKRLSVHHFFMWYRTGGEKTRRKM